MKIFLFNTVVPIDLFLLQKMLRNVFPNFVESTIKDHFRCSPARKSKFEHIQSLNEDADIQKLITYHKCR